MNEQMIPFGLRFAEDPSHQINNDISNQPYYDIDLGISLIHDDNGALQPFVLWAWNFAGDTRTGTTTKAQGDAEDTDEDRNPRTHTVTETRENTDNDY